jgi:prepilin-type N-terminal cleavage/methylation domain-containing protein
MFILMTFLSGNCRNNNQFKEKVEMTAANRELRKVDRTPKIIGCGHMVVNYRRRSGFTLIELLVVIAIIALLLSILMPALTKAKNQAMRVICKSQQHQAGLGLVMYASENNSKLPVGTFFNYPIATHGNSDSSDPPHGPKDDGFVGTDVQHYLSSEDVSIFICPANKLVRRMPAYHYAEDTRGMSTYEWYKSGHFNNFGSGDAYSNYIYCYYFGNYPWDKNSNLLTGPERGLKAKGLLYPSSTAGPRAKVMQDLAMEESDVSVLGYNEAHKYPNSLWTDGSVDSCRLSDLEPHKRTLTPTVTTTHYW